MLSGRAADGTAENAGGTEGPDVVHGAAGRVQGGAAPLRGTERYLSGQPDRQPAVWRNGRTDRDVRQHAGIAQPGGGRGNVFGAAGAGKSHVPGSVRASGCAV